MDCLLWRVLLLFLPLSLLLHLAHWLSLKKSICDLLHRCTQWLLLLCLLLQWRWVEQGTCLKLALDGLGLRGRVVRVLSCRIIYAQVLNYHRLLTTTSPGGSLEYRWLIRISASLTHIELLGYWVVNRLHLAYISHAVITDLSRPVIALFETFSDVQQFIDTGYLLLFLGLSVLTPIIALIKDSFLKLLSKNACFCSTSSVSDWLELTVLGQVLYYEAWVHLVVPSWLLTSALNRALPCIIYTFY